MFQILAEFDLTGLKKYSRSARYFFKFILILYA